MQLYSITAIDSKGNKIKKLLEMEDTEDITSYLDAVGADIISVNKVPKFYKYLKTGKRIKTAEVIEVIENMHLVVKAGLPVNTGLLDLAKDADSSAMRDILEDTANRIQTGMTFSKAISKYSRIFSGITVNLIRIGEETGRLDSTLKDAAEHMKKVSDLKSKTKAALVYPSFALGAMMITMIFWLVVVMPKLIQAFKSFNLQLPPVTLMVLALSEFTQKYIVLIVICAIGFLAAHVLLRQTNRTYRYVTDKMLINIPIFGKVVKNFNFAFIAEYIRLMISAGLPLYMSLSIMEESLKNRVFRKSIENTRELISMGSSFSSALGEQKMYPNIILRMVGIGEQTGDLDVQLDNIAEYYYLKVDYTATNVSKMIEPIVIGFVGIFMLVIVLGLLSPIFSLITNLPT